MSEAGEEDDEEVAEAGDEDKQGGEEGEAGLVQKSIRGRHTCSKKERGRSRCCYITVDSAMGASQNGFCSYKLSSHKKTNIMQIMT